MTYLKLIMLNILCCYHNGTYAKQIDKTKTIAKGSGLVAASLIAASYGTRMLFQSNNAYREYRHYIKVHAPNETFQAKELMIEMIINAIIVYGLSFYAAYKAYKTLKPKEKNSSWLET